MRHYKFEKLKDVFRGVNREYLVNPHDTVEYSRSFQSYIDDLFIEIGPDMSLDLDINLHRIGFDPARKWSHLVKSYIDPEAYEQFWESVVTSGGTSIQFRFNNRKGPNGPCLIALVFTRDNGKKPWNKVKIIWRTTELQRKFGADLVLINKILTEIPEEAKEWVKLEKITFYLAQAYQSALLVGPLTELFCDWDEIDFTHEHTKKMKSRFDKFLGENRVELKYKQAIKMRDLYDKVQAGAVPEWDISELSLASELEVLKAKLKK